MQPSVSENSKTRYWDRYCIKRSLTQLLLIFRSSEVQKERCRKAAKARRLRESKYFKELAKLVGNNTKPDDKQNLDKISIVRLSSLIKYFFCFISS